MFTNFPNRTYNLCISIAFKLSIAPDIITLLHINFLPRSETVLSSEEKPEKAAYRDARLFLLATSTSTITATATSTTSAYTGTVQLLLPLAHIQVHLQLPLLLALIQVNLQLPSTTTTSSYTGIATTTTSAYTGIVQLLLLLAHIQV